MLNIREWHIYVWTMVSFFSLLVQDLIDMRASMKKEVEPDLGKNVKTKSRSTWFALCSNAPDTGAVPDSVDAMSLAINYANVDSVLHSMIWSMTTSNPVHISHRAGMYPCSTKTREVLGNPSLTAERFPSTLISRVSGNLEGGGDGFLVLVEYGHSLIINLSTGSASGNPSMWKDWQC